MKERLQKIISRAGIASRRKAEELIIDGRVRVNNEIIIELGSKADITKDRITIDGEAISSPENRVYLILNKPSGYICSRNDPENRPTVLDLIKNINERIFPVGRLDYDTEGLIVLTNDGDFSQILQHPSSNIPRTYLVKVKEIPKEEDLARLRQGIYIDKIKTNEAKIKIVNKLPKNAWLEVVLWEGRNRQIKKMFEAIGHRSLRIVRTEFGPISLKNLAQGTFRFMNRKEINDVRKLGRSK
jgi:pseudouridine synthase